MKYIKTLSYLSLLIFFTANVSSHQDQDSRIKFWKEYYNPQVEVTQEKIPDVKIILHKIGPFYQLETNVQNFKFTPDRDMKDNNPWTGYGKLYINGKFVTRIYNKITFLKSIPIGQNEIKVILSSNMDHDVAINKKLIFDQIDIRFPDYNFAEARAYHYDLFIKCEFSDKGKARTKKLAAKGLSASESSEYLQCTLDSNDVIKPFVKDMSKVQKAHFNITMDTLAKRINLWKSFEKNQISLSEAREGNKLLDESSDEKMQAKMKEFGKK